jgi:hypothetical protein
MNLTISAPILLAVFPVVIGYCRSYGIIIDSRILLMIYFESSICNNYIEYCDNVQLFNSLSFRFL